ncbi:hypothetical protein QBC41DRAFT_302884 [Cercophora samala]|uniref:Uncharacterized protein n=1 Tax=Cercophora samala TaxID=330535 RepID=A0AA40DBP0_9PEZI|nr:hypothetical protein QBC41DRAFT_302884 [Cercophora samala]
MPDSSRTFSPSGSSTDFSSSDDGQSSERGPLAIARRKLLEKHPNISSVRVPAPSAKPEGTQPAARTPLPSVRPQPTLRPQPLSTPARGQSTSAQIPVPNAPARPKLGYFPSPRSTLPPSRPAIAKKQQQQEEHQQPSAQPDEPLIAPPFACLPGTLAPPSAIAALHNTATPGPSLTNPIFPIPASSLAPAVFSTTLTPSQKRLFNVDIPNGYPRFVPPANLTPETDPSTFRACDCVVTMLWLYSPRLAVDFFGPNGAEYGAVLEVFDNRVQEHWAQKETGEGLYQVPQFGVWRMGDEVAIGFRTQSSKKMCRYRARISWDTGSWAGIEAKDEEVSAWEGDEEKVERIGAFIGRELLFTRFWHRQPYYTFSIQVDGMRLFNKH